MEIFQLPLVGVAGFEPATSCSQSRRDNRATLHPEGILYYAERQGFEPWHRLPDDRLAICSVTTPAPLLLKPVFDFESAKIHLFIVFANLFKVFLKNIFTFLKIK